MASSGTPPIASPSRAVWPLLVVLFGSFVDLLDATIVIVATPAIDASIGASDAQATWFIAAYALALGSGLITGGRLGDSYGRKRIFLLGVAAFGVTSVLCALAPTSGALVAFRSAQGLAAGIMVPQVFGIIRGSFEPVQRARAFGAYGAVQGLAAVAGPLVGGVLVSADLFGLGWRSIFWINVPICLFAFIVGIRVLPESRAPDRARFDLVGAGLGATGILLLLLPLIQSTSWGWRWPSVALLIGAVATIGAFVAWERRVSRRGGEPVFDPALLHARAFSVGLVASLLFFAGIGALFLMLSVYLQDGVGRTPLATGLAMAPFAAGMIVTSSIGVSLGARAGRATLIGGSLIVACGFGMLGLVVRDGTDPGYWWLAAGMLVGGLGFGLVVPILVNVILAGVPARNAGSAGGVLSTVNQIAGAGGIAVIATVFFGLVNGSGNGPGLPEYGSAFGDALLGSSLLYIAAAGVMALLPRAVAEGAKG